MAKVRSPNYPALGLADALEAIRPVYKAEHRNKMGRETLARHMGYASLNGRALGKIGAVRAYGLIDGSGDDLRVSEDAMLALMAPEDAPERAQAIGRLAFKPQLFRDIRTDFPNVHPSEPNLRFWLSKQGFTPEAAGKAAATYLITMRLVDESGGGYNPSASQGAEDKVQIPGVGEVSKADAQRHARMPPINAYADQTLDDMRAVGIRKEVFTLDEGDAVITFPDNLSAESFADLKAHMDLFIKKMQRRAGRHKLTAEEEADLIGDDPKSN